MHQTDILGDHVGRKRPRLGGPGYATAVARGCRATEGRWPPAAGKVDPGPGVQRPGTACGERAEALILPSALGHTNMGLPCVRSFPAGWGFVTLDEAGMVDHKRLDALTELVGARTPLPSHRATSP